MNDATLHEAHKEDHESFMKRLSGLPQEDQDDIEHAYVIGKDAHRSQRRKTGERYWEHPRGVAIILMDELGHYDADDLAAACLHDTVEDTKYVTVSKIGRWFNGTVANLVDVLTKHPGLEADGYWARIADYPRAAMIKGADRLHNLRSMRGCEREFIEKQVLETRERVLPALQARIGQTWYAAKLQRLVNLIERELVLLDDWLSGGIHKGMYEI